MLAAMVRSGIPILDALVISSATAENKVISGVIMDVRNKVSQGESLAAPMKGSNIFPPMQIRHCKKHLDWHRKWATSMFR